MSEEPRKRVDRMYELVWREHDLEGALAGLPAHFEWVVPGHPDGAIRRGPDAVIAFFRDWIGEWDDPHSEWSLEQTGPDTVLALVRTSGRGPRSGVPIEQSFAQLWSFEDGEPARMVLYTDVDKARRAARAGPR
jgi:ketosteroid isomerase-like protein